MTAVPMSFFQPAPLVPVVIRATPSQLERFKALMACDGRLVHLHRMCLDLAYARERIAEAHTSANDPLRAMAVELFEACLPGVATPLRPH